eukprot:6859570-Karenia_brevis.AAC.1
MNSGYTSLRLATFRYASLDSDLLRCASSRTLHLIMPHLCSFRLIMPAYMLSQLIAPGEAFIQHVPPEGVPPSTAMCNGA